jgi:hypothetical protein
MHMNFIPSRLGIDAKSWYSETLEIFSLLSSRTDSISVRTNRVVKNKKKAININSTMTE